MNTFRAGFSRYAALARGELRLMLKGAPAFSRRALVMAAWGLAAILAGSVVGFIATTLPPMALVGYVGGFALVLLWAAPDIPAVSDVWLRRMFFVALAVNICVPIYYTVQVASLPWISARRLVNFALVALAALAFATSPSARQRIIRMIRANPLISSCIFGFPIAAFLSIFTSISPFGSISSFLSMIIELYIPFLAALYVIRTADDVTMVITIILLCSLFNSFIGVLDFILHKHVMVSLLPKSLLESLLASNPALEALITVALRHNEFRASSVFNTSLNFAEFEAMIAPIAAVFTVYRREWRGVILGLSALLGCTLGIFVSGSRGGFAAVIVAFGLLSILWAMRSRGSRSLKRAVAGVSIFVGLVLVICAVLFVGQVHRRVLGGGGDQASTDARRLEWELAKPKILASPIIGQGFGNSGNIIGYYSPGSLYPSVDSTVVSTLAETGVLGLVTFFGIFLASIRTASWRYVADLSWGGALMGGSAASLAGYTTYRLALTVNENGLLAYVLVACVMALNFEFVRRGRVQYGDARR